MLGLHFPIRNSKHVCVYLTEQVVDQLEKSWSLTLSVWWHKMSIVDVQYGNRLVCSQMAIQSKTINSKPLSSSTSLSLDPNTLRAFLPPQSTSVASSSYRTSSQLWDIACSILYISLCLQNNLLNNVSMSSEQPYTLQQQNANLLRLGRRLPAIYISKPLLEPVSTHALPSLDVQTTVIAPLSPPLNFNICAKPTVVFPPCVIIYGQIVCPIHVSVFLMWGWTVLEMECVQLLNIKSLSFIVDNECKFKNELNWPRFLALRSTYALRIHIFLG